MNQMQNQSVSNQQKIAAQQAALRQKSEYEKKKDKNSLVKKVVITAVAVIVVLVLAFFVYTRLLGGSGVKSGQYQAVFLTNGQVYFGKLEDPTSKYVTLTDVYYLQVQNSEEKGNDQNQQLSQGEPQLIKLGEELHGPEDEMKISQTQISFWENLKDKSKVVEAIENYQEK